PATTDRPPATRPPPAPHAVEQGEDAFRRVVIREERERSDLPPDDARRRRRHARPELLHESLQDAWVALPQEGDVRASAILHPEDFEISQGISTAETVSSREKFVRGATRAAAEDADEEELHARAA